MLVVNYNGNKPISNYFKYGVEGNNNTDVIRFVLSKIQSYIDLSTSDTIKVRVRNDDEDFVEEYDIGENMTNVVDNTFFVDFPLPSEITQLSNVEISLCFSKESDVWQTQTFKLKLMSGIIIEEE